MDLRTAVLQLLDSNRVESGGYRYTRPAPGTYEHQWLWDSCFHSLIWRHFDPDMAWDELAALLYHRGTDTDGMIPHMVYWSGGGLEYFGRDEVSNITQPPMVADTMLRIHATSPRTDLLRNHYDRLAAHYQWLHRKRTVENGLLAILHPWESGWDASPRWDCLLGLSHPDPKSTWRARIRLARELTARGADLERVRAEGGFYVVPVDFNSIYAANLRALARIASILGKQRAASSWQLRAEAVEQAINQHLWDPVMRNYFDFVPGRGLLRVPSCAGFFALFAGIPSRHRANLLRSNLRSAYMTACPLPTLDPSHGDFAPTDYWRGNTWLSVNWFIVQGLLRYGFTGTAHRIGTLCRTAVESHGFREYYHPLTGEGLGADRQSWSGIILDLTRCVS
jgi:glycogen debranching enzyme